MADAWSYIGTVILLILMAVGLVAFSVHRMIKEIRRLKSKSRKLTSWIVEPPPIEVSRSAARDRERYLLSVMDRGGEPPITTVFEDPPGESVHSILQELPLDEAAAQAAALQWERDLERQTAGLGVGRKGVDLANEECHVGIRLMGRVGDALTALAMSRGLTIGQLAPRLSLERIHGPDAESRKTLPYAVVIETHYRAVVESYLEKLRSWLCIGVRLEVDAVPLVRFQSCRESQATPGFVGGYLGSDAGPIYPLTCSHILAPNCSCAIYQAELKPETNVPDVALLRPSGCFAPLGAERVRLTVGDEDDAFRARGHDIVRLPGRKGRGRIHNVSKWAEYEGRLHKFPHVQIEPNIMYFLDFIPWPPWRRYFSRKGHSGSWVTTNESGVWIGLLVGGNEFTHLTEAVLAAPLLTFLNNMQPHLNPSVPMAELAVVYGEETPP